MTRHDEPEILDAGTTLTLTELCECLNTEEGFVVTCVQFGIADVDGSHQQNWVFSHTAQTRIRRAWNLHRDLDINHSGLGVVLDLLDDLEGMRQRVALLEQRLKGWEHHNHN